MIAWMLVTAAALAAGHRVLREGETVESLARELDLNPQALRELNALPARAAVPPGTVLMLPDTGTVSAQKARVLSVTGTGRVTTPEQEVLPLECGRWMAPGTTICTSVESYATIRLAEDDSGDVFDDIRLSSSTCLTVVEASGGEGLRSSLVKLTEGSVQVDRARDEGGRITVRTPMSLTTTDGGSFRVTLEEDAARTEALTENVVVMAAGEEVPLDAGQGSRVVRDQAPTQAIVLLDTGFLLKPDNDAELIRPDFTWTPVDAALGYRIQLATSPDFSRILYQEDVPFPEWRPDFLLLPTDVPALWWRVSSFDRFGFESPPSNPRRLTVPGRSSAAAAAEAP